MRIIVDGGDGSGELVVVHSQINLLEHSSHLLLPAEELAELLQVEGHPHLSQLVTDTSTVHQLRSYLVLLRPGAFLPDFLFCLPLNPGNGQLMCVFSLSDSLPEGHHRFLLLN